jgi:hypothetical protein
MGKIPAAGLQHARVAAFDTRVAVPERGFALRLLMKVVGYAAPRIAKGLQAKGGHLAAAPEGFIVQDTKGPLKDGELQRAEAWARGLPSAQ